MLSPVSVYQFHAQRANPELHAKVLAIWRLTFLICIFLFPFKLTEILLVIGNVLLLLA